MKYHVEAIREPFQAREAAEMSGVPPVMQRDWRRRGIMEERVDAGRKKFLAPEICLMKMMKLLTDAQMSLSGTLALSRQLALNVEVFLDRLEGGFSITGAELSEEETTRFLEEVARGPLERFAFVPLPEREGPDGHPDLYFMGTLDRLPGVVRSDRWSAGLVMDLRAIAEEIITKAPRPLVKYVLREASE